MIGVRPGFLPQEERCTEMDRADGSQEGLWRSLQGRESKQSCDAGKSAVQQVNSAGANFSGLFSSPHSHALLMKIFFRPLTP